ncbi:MAG TPA: choice-of-anchor D domain-containing protein [bacterium]|nr:choice-of-anchor D domain-containing protein [bacterium]HQG44396.1 choice-of-anchor D domain-containing protein [bacterium]HQI47374.1 choice-of-anchor D domain-containing protein [bacterium]HQJ63024.1 choice-of-anchor D domain-containing protein [bacterium]
MEKTKGLCIRMIVLATMLAAPLIAREDGDAIDFTTGKAAAGRRPVALARQSVTAGNVLWDLTHGVYLDYQPERRYSMICDSLHGRGYSVVTTTNIASADLNAYKILVISLGSAWEGSYTEAERDKVVAFVRNGGGLLLMGDNPLHCPNGNLRRIAEAFGVTLGVSWQDEYSITGFSDHYLCGGLTRLHWQAWGDLGVTDPARAVIFGRYNHLAVAVAEAGAGRVVVAGDVNFCDNDYHLNYDNKLLTYNIFDWLAQSTREWTGGPFDFNDGTTQGWSHSKVFLYNGSAVKSNFAFGLSDEVNYPNAPGKDPLGDNKMSLGFSTPGGLGIDNSEWKLWAIAEYSPELAYSSAWQNAAGVSVKIAESMAGSGVVLTAMIHLVGYDQDALHYFQMPMERADTLIHDDPSDDLAEWNDLTFIWAGKAGLPTNYIIHKFMIVLLGTTSGEYLPGGLYIDEVEPIAPGGAPDIACNAAALSFGIVSVGQWPEKTIILSNTGTARLTVKAPRLTGPDAGEFHLAGDVPGFALRPGDSRPVTIRFAPLSAGSKKAELSFTSNDPDESPLIITLTGTGGGETGRLITFSVTTPVSTPAGDAIYLAGNFNAWDPGPAQAGTDGQQHDLLMTQTSDYHWQIVLPFAKNQTLEYKYTRGGWDKVEKGPGGEEISNRIQDAGDADLKITDVVGAWADVGSAVEDRTSGEVSAFRLEQNYPNPFNPATLIRYTLPAETEVTLEIFDALGQRVRSLVNQRQQAGNHTVWFNASGLASGLYVCRLQAGTWQANTKMLLIR